LHRKNLPSTRFPRHRTPPGSKGSSLLPSFLSEHPNVNMQRGLRAPFPSIQPLRPLSLLSPSKPATALLFRQPPPSARRSFSSSLPPLLFSSRPSLETTKPASGVSVDGTSIAHPGERVVDLSDEGREDGETEEDELGLMRGEDGVVRGGLSRLFPSPVWPSDLHIILTGMKSFVAVGFHPSGKLSPTNSHLLRLTLPLPSVDRPCAFVLHPTQPLSYVARLISAEMPPGSVGNVE